MSAGTTRQNRAFIRFTVSLLGVTGVLTPWSLQAQPLTTWSVSSNALELGSGSDELFQAVRFGRLFADGAAVVADAQGLFVRVYMPDGTLQSTMGSRGTGPGEFRAIHGLWLTPEGSIGVWDGRSRRLTTFDASGRLLSTGTAQPEGRMRGGNLELFLGSFRDGDVLLGSLHLGRVRALNEVVPESWLLGRFSADGEPRVLIGEVQGMWRMHRAPIPFSPVPRMALRADSVLIIHGYDTELQVRSADKVVRTIGLPWRVHPARDPWSSLETELRRGGKGMFLELLRHAPRTDQYPAASGLLVDDSGNVWIREYDPLFDSVWLKPNALSVAPGGTWRVLRPDGRWLSSIQLPDNLVPLDIRGSRLLGVEHDELDVQRVVVRGVLR